MSTPAAVCRLGLLAWAIGCAGDAGKAPLDTPRCSSDATCGSGRACVHATCVDCRPTAPAWAFEVSPPLDSEATFTEVLFSEGLNPTHPSLPVGGRTRVTATFRPTGGPTNATATGKLAVSVRPRLGGRPDLLFEVPDPADPKTIEISTDALGRPGMIQLMPLPPGDLEHPPLSFPIEALAATHELLIPTTVALIGRIERTSERALMGFVARAFQAGRRISNLGRVEDGRFRLFIPEEPSYGEVRVRLAPEGTNPVDPSFLSDPLDPASEPARDLGTITLPPYWTPEFFHLSVVEEGGAGAVVPGVRVRARTRLDSRTTYVRDGVTDENGRALLELIPGNDKDTEKRPYEITVLPDAGSPFVTHCVQRDVPRGEPNPGSAHPLPSVAIPRRSHLTGRVMTGASTAVRDVVVRATLRRALSCSTSPSATTTPTGSNGDFELWLDPGTYDFEFDPPPASTLARLTSQVEISGPEPPSLGVQLVEGAVVGGEVVDRIGMPVRDATVRIFEPRCNGDLECFGPKRTPPLLVSEARTDAAGQFRAIVPPLPTVATSTEGGVPWCNR